MIAVALAALVLAGVTLVVVRNRQRPEEKPVRIETKDRRDPQRR